MRGDLKSAWPYVWSDIWVRLYETKGAPVELFAELYATLMPKPRVPASPAEPDEFDENGVATDPAYLEALATYEAALEAYRLEKIVYSEALTAEPEQARIWLREGLPHTLKTETDAVRALEKAFQCIDDIGGDDLSNRYVTLVESFLKKYSIRYDFRRPFSLHPNLPGIFSAIWSEVRVLCLTDAQLERSVQEFDDAFRDLKLGANAGRLKTCFIKQFNLLEAITARNPAVTQNVLSGMISEVHTWPHATVKQAAEKIYAFRGAYPNMGHGTGGGATREIELLDLVSVSVMLVGLLPYLSHEIDPQIVFEGAA
jgi:tetratricopeptide (TPR) repeat protein